MRYREILHQTEILPFAASSIFTYDHYPYPYLAGGHLCFDRTYMVSTPVSTFSNDDITIEVKLKTNTAHTGCGVIFSYRMSEVFTVLACRLGGVCVCVSVCV